MTVDLVYAGNSYFIKTDKESREIFRNHLESAEAYEKRCFEQFDAFVERQRSWKVRYESPNIIKSVQI